MHYNGLVYQLVSNPGDGPRNFFSVSLVISVKAVCEENEEREGETGHSSPDHPWPVHQHVQFLDFSRVLIPHCSPKSNHLLSENVKINSLDSGPSGRLWALRVSFEMTGKTIAKKSEVATKKLNIFVFFPKILFCEYFLLNLGWMRYSQPTL